ncbi:hypothetical protein K488DRAFT_72046 [Vararia minispora EC-137]|uniref:Uncharacterized protein n=1 Tax=Vararia minispora EC-137 TaxID=1314806 RepID=A0ACB8QFL4_9AGAM|nr:hypothetical protein K488DRAFT_72046 [Vararia minispora EC-137]
MAVVRGLALELGRLYHTCPPLSARHTHWWAFRRRKHTEPVPVFPDGATISVRDLRKTFPMPWFGRDIRAAWVERDRYYHHEQTIRRGSPSDLRTVKGGDSCEDLNRFLADCDLRGKEQ